LNIPSSSWLLLEQSEQTGVFVTKLFVGNLSFSTTEDDLTSLFSQYGAVESVNAITDRMTGQPRGFAFVEMTNRSEAEKAISYLNGSDLQGRTLNVNEARPKTDTPRSGAGNSRGGNRFKRSNW
jgi:cold-inducible RNA-binding protein